MGIVLVGGKGGEDRGRICRFWKSHRKEKYINGGDENPC